MQTGKWQITIYLSKMEGAKKGYTYEVFQIFTGKVEDDRGILSNLKYVENYGNKGIYVPDEVVEKASRVEIDYEKLVGELFAVLADKKLLLS